MIPNFFEKAPLPTDVSRDLWNAVEELKACSSRDTCLRKAYDIVTRRVHGGRFRTALFWKWFEDDVDRVWHERGYWPCHVQNYLLRSLLIWSGHFTDHDLTLGRSWVWLFPHQYLIVHVDRETAVDVDTWGRSIGVPFAQHAQGFK